MSARPVVSVIMPAYNTSPYVAAAIASARAQTVSNIEILVVDDGSTDRTFASALRAADGDGRVHVITQNNRGPSSARNRAMKIAKGEFFALLDSDDEWMPDFLESQLAAFDRRPSADVVTANALNLGGPLDGTPYRPIRPDDRLISFRDMVQEEDAVCITSVFRRSVYATAGPFNERLSGNEDYEFWLRAAWCGCEFVQTFEPRAYYRRRPDSASADDLKMVGGILQVFEMFQLQCRTADERNAIDRQIARYERTLLAVEARLALRRHDFKKAADDYERLFQRSGEKRVAALRLAALHAPRLLLWFADLRRVFRRATSRLARAQVRA
jgi:glycosyltransferase involved in cell wall biosynthesis